MAMQVWGAIIDKKLRAINIFFIGRASGLGPKFLAVVGGPEFCQGDQAPLAPLWRRRWMTPGRMN